jgi:hypothetical protein
VLSAFEFAGLDPPPSSKIAAVIRNFGGVDRIDELMTLVRRLAAAGDLSVERLLSAIATQRIRRSASARRGNRATTTATAPSLPTDDARQARLEAIQEASRGG